jgi:predicted transcriptional regulator
MRTTKVVSISLPEAQYKKAVRLAKKENRTMSELMREALRVYETQGQRRAEAFKGMGEAIAEAQRQSVLNGIDKMTMDEINEEIAAVRREVRKRASLSKTA